MTHRPLTRGARAFPKPGYCQSTTTSAVSSSAMVTSLQTTLFSFDGSGLPIETVTVYRPSGAQVIRKLDVDLKVSTVKSGGVRSAFPTVSLNHICAR